MNQEPRTKLAARNLALLDFRDAALHLAYRACGNTADAEDILQTAYLRAVAAPEPILAGSALRNWFFQITANAARDHFRSESRRRSREKDAAMQPILQPDASAGAEDAELRRQVETELNRLDEKYRLPVSLHYEHGLSYDEASAVLGMTAGTLRVYASQGIKELRERLGAPSRPVSAEILLALLGAGLTLKASPALASSVEAIVEKGALAQPAAAAGVAKPLIAVANSSKSLPWVALCAAAMVGVAVFAFGAWRAMQSVMKKPAPIVRMPPRPEPKVVVDNAPPPPMPSRISFQDPNTAAPAPMTPPPAPALALAPAPAQAPLSEQKMRELDAAWANADELLNLVAPKNHTLCGDWSYQNQNLVCAPGAFTRVSVPYIPPEEYDFRVDFTRTASIYDINMIFPANGESCLWKMDSWSSCYFGAYKGNPDAVRRRGLTNNVRHVAIVEVRRKTLTAYVDGELVCSIEPDKSSHLCSSDYRLPDQRMLGLGAWRSGVQFHRAAVRAVTGKGTPLPPDADLANAVSDEYWKDALDLMPAAVEPGNALAGHWTAANGALSTDAVKNARYQLPYAPPEEYDFRIDFTRLDGRSDIAQIIAAGGRQFLWKMDIAAVFCFDVVNGTGRDTNPTALLVADGVSNGAPHSSVVCVRKTGVKAYVDGRLISNYPTNYKGMSIEATWSLPSKEAIGVGFHVSPGTFHAIKVKPVTGTGHPLTPVPVQEKPDGF